MVINWYIIDGKLVVKDGERTTVMGCPDKVLEAMRRSHEEAQITQSRTLVAASEPDSESVYHITSMR